MYIMTSTNLKNACGMYKLEQKINTDHIHKKTYKGQTMPRRSNYPNLGVNYSVGIGGYYNNVLSNNTTDIESQLYGIGSSNLVEKKEPTIPQLNKLEAATFFNPKIPLSIPNPLVVEKNHRETGPFS
jgi:hypothetical protein